MIYLIGPNGSHCGYVPFSESGRYEDEGSVGLYETFDLSLDLEESDPDYINRHLFTDQIFDQNSLTLKNVWRNTFNKSHS